MLGNQQPGDLFAAGRQSFDAAMPASAAVPEMDPGYNPFEDAAVNPEVIERRPAPQAPSLPESPEPVPEPVPAVAVNPLTGKPKRHRRTKAEMEAAKAEEARRRAELEALEPSVPETDAPVHPFAGVGRVEGFGILSKLLRVRMEIGTIERDSTSDIRDDSGNPYRFRSLEGMLSVLNPVLAAQGLFLTFEDDVLAKTPDFVYIRTRANLFDAETGEVFSTTGLAREDFSIGDKWASQITGSCSTYARKYALSAMFAFSSTKADDPDRDALAPARAAAVQQTQGKALLAPGVGAWNGAVREASEWTGTAEELETAIRRRFDINEVNLAILLRKAGVIKGN